MSKVLYITEMNFVLTSLPRPFESGLWLNNLNLKNLYSISYW